MHLWAHFLTALLLVAAVITAQPSTQPSLNKSEVYVPWKEFRQIIDRLAQPDTVAEDTIHAPTDYVLTSAKISGEVTDNSSARFSVRLALTVLPSLALKENGWVTVGLGRMSNRAVLEAVTVEGKVLPLHTEDGEYRLLFSKAGVYPLTLVYHCAVASDEGTSSIDIMLPKTLAAGLDFTLAGTRADITVNGTRIPVEKKGNGVRIRTPLSTDNGVHINYTPLGREESGEDTTRITPRVYAATGLLADIRENSIRYQYRVDYQIWHKKITSFAIALPDTFAIEEVQGAGIAQWKLEQREGKPVLSVATNFTPEKAYSMTIRFSRKLEKVADRIPVPSLRALNVNRENGCLAVVSQQTMEVTIADSLSRLTAVDQSELHPWMRSRNDLLMRFKYIHPPYHLSLDVKRHSDMPVLVAIADDVAFTTLLTEEGYVLSRFRYHIRNNHKQYLRVGMPGGWRLWSALIDGGPVMPATSGNEEVLIPLKKMASDDNGEGFRLELVYWKEWKKMRLRGRFSFSMPDIDINAQKISGDLWVPKQFRYTGFKGSLERSGFSAETAYRSVPDTWSTANSNMRRDRRFGKMANQQITKSRKGIALTLPVEISVPTEGTQFHFTKKLTISGEKADLSLSFRKRLPDFGKPFGLLFPIIFFLTGFICMRVSLRRRSLKSILIAFAAGLAVVIFFLLVREIFHNTYPGLSMFLLGIAAGAVAHCAYGVKRRIAESTAIVLLLAGLTLPPPAFSRDDADDENTELTGSTVAVPWSDFKQILERIRKPERYDTARPVVPPVAYVIGSGDYRGERSGEGQFLFSARLNISVLEQRSWVEIGLAQGAAVFPDVKVLFPAGGTASIGTDASGNNSLIVRGAGNYTVSFRFTAPIVEQSGVSTVRFPMPYQTAASLRLDLDKPDYRVTANGIPLAPRSAGSGHTVYEGAIGGNNSATISWQQEVSQISAQDAMLLGQVNTFCSIG
ncbi:MAG: hypothetical protein JW863_21845, partial [Chitinispirillaceae bacterium]|nr:hypothetical protein [Chitinispirillaceae bacterium]